MTADIPYDEMFSGIIGQEYRMLKLICPLSVEMSRLVGQAVGEYCRGAAAAVKVVELGGGTGITTLAILSADDRLTVASVDNEPAMQNQAKETLKSWADAGRLAFIGEDALTALRGMAAESADLLATAYTLHNFRDDYRGEVIREIYRVLKPGGRFINGDRYALNDVSEHTRAVQREIAEYFRVLTGLNRLDLLEHWIIHLFNDESGNHIMREAAALAGMAEAGFVGAASSHRQDANALVIADKPG